MTAKLQQPRRGRRRRAEECEIVLIFAEGGSATPAAAGTRAGTTRIRVRATAARTLRRLLSQHFVSLHDLGDLAVSVSTERDGEQFHDRGTLRGRQIAHAQALSLEHGGRQIRPARLLRSLERKLHFGATGVIELGPATPAPTT
jgi:hypothetical protein